MYMCLPFEVGFHIFWYCDRVFFLTQMKAPNLAKLGVFWKIWEDLLKKAPNLSKTGCFSIKIGILMGRFLGQK